MTREEANFIGAMNMCDEISNEAYKKIMCHCEEQKPILDKIRAEIMQLDYNLESVDYDQNDMAMTEEVHMICREELLQIIDRYRVESEDKNADKKCTYKETGCGSCKWQLDCPIEADKAESEDT